MGGPSDVYSMDRKDAEVSIGKLVCGIPESSRAVIHCSHALSHPGPFKPIVIDTLSYQLWAIKPIILHAFGNPERLTNHIPCLQRPWAVNPSQPTNNPS